VFWNRIARGTPVQGWASVVILIAFSAGIQMLMLGVLGEYVWRTLDETRRRPAFIIDEVFEKQRAATAQDVVSEGDSTARDHRGLAAS
jgi:dolichol-phosphate mannosyltransferase